MNIFEIVIKPKSAFATTLKGDTIFGSLCWHIENLGFGLTDLLRDYDKSPFMVCSSAFWKSKDQKHYVFKKPDIPSFLLFCDKDPKKRKENNKKDFFICNTGQAIELCASNIKTQKEILSDIGEFDEQSFISYDNVMHASINRNSFTTDQDGFAPFSMELEFYCDKLNPVIFIAIDESRFDKDKLIKSCANLGKAGFGKKASIGYGHFDVLSCEETLLFKNLPTQKFSYLYTLSPFIPADGDKLEFFQPFTRFGKHGDALAMNGKPFKKPIIMADEGALLKTDNYNLSFPIAGKAIDKISDSDTRTVSQGYSLCLPINLPTKENAHV